MSVTTDLKPESMDDREWSLRVQLANCYRLIDYFGWTDAIFNHISLRVPGPGSHYLVNPFGLTYDEVTPLNLVKVDGDGNLVEPSDYPANRAGFALHGVIHANRSDAHCVIHTHTVELSAVAIKKAGLGHDDFYGAQLHGQVGYHTFEGITLFAEERQRMLASLGDKPILILRNHGVAVCGRSVAHAFFLHYILQRAAQIQCKAGALPGDDLRLGDDIRMKCVELVEDLSLNDQIVEKMFDALVRKMLRSRQQSPIPATPVRNAGSLIPTP